MKKVVFVLLSTVLLASASANACEWLYGLVYSGAFWPGVDVFASLEECKKARDTRNRSITDENRKFWCSPKSSN
jgi:hypothetical protein